MAKGDDITTKFKVDISDLKKGITEANKQIKLANAEFKAASSGMDNWEKSSEGLNAKLTQLKTVLTAQVTKLKNYKDQLKEVEETKSKNAKVADTLRKKLEELANNGVSKTSDEYKKYEKQLSEVEKEMAANGNAADKLKITILNQQGAINGTVKEMRNYKNSLDDVENESKDAENSNKQLEKSFNDVEGGANKLKEGFTVMKGALSSLVADGIRTAISATKDFAKEMISTAATVKAENSQFEQTFGDMGKEAEAAIKRVADSSGILETRLKTTGAQIYAFARSNGATVPEAMKLMEEALMASADGAAYYDKSLEESAETLQSFLKGNYANDAALGVSATEFTRNAKATELFGKKYNDLTEIQKQQTLLKMVTDSQKVSGAMGQAAREADGWENVQGNLNETWRQFQAQVGTPFLEALIPVIQKLTKNFKEWSATVDWDAFGKKVEKNLGKVEDGFEWIIKNHKTVTSGIKLMIAAFAVAKINSFTKSMTNTTKAIIKNSTAVDANGKAITLLSNVTKTATVAQNANTVATNAGAIAGKAFSAAWKANPIGLIVTSLSLAIPLITKFVGWIKEATKETDKDVIATEKLVEKHNKLNKEINSNAKAREKAISAAGKETATADILLKKLDELAGVENKSASEKETMKRLVTELNSVMPELNIKYDEEKDALNKSTEAIKANIAASKELSKAKAAQSQLTKIAADMAKLEMEQTELVKNRTKLEKEYNNAHKERMEFQNKYGLDQINHNTALMSQYNELLISENKKKKALDETNSTLKENKDSLNKLNGEYDKTTQYAEKMYDRAEIQTKIAALTDLAKAQGREIPEALAQGMLDGRYAVPESIEQMDALINFDNALSAAGLAGTEIPRSISQGVMNGKVSVQDAIAQVNQVVDFNKSLDKAKKDGAIIPKNLSDSMISGKISLSEANEQLNSAIEFSKALNKAKEDGVTIPSNLAKSVKNGKLSVQEAADQLNAAIEFKKAVDKAKTNGIEVPKSLAKSIKDGSLQPQQAVDEMNALMNYDKTVADAKEAGVKIPKSISESINSGKLLPSQAINGINDLMSYQAMIDKAGLEGVKIPTKLSESIINGKLTVDNATAQMNNWIDLNKALENTGFQGDQIPKTLANKVLSGKVTVEEAKNQMNNWIEFKAALDASSKAGADIPKNIEQGILSGKMKPKEAIKKLNTDVVTESDKLPSKLKTSGTKSGNFYLDGLLSGTQDTKRRTNIYTSSEGVGTEMKNRLNKSLNINSPSKATEQSGKYFLDGIAIGIANQNKRNSIFNSIAAFGASLLSKLKNALAEKSPSKATKEMGEYLLEGLGIGIEKQENPVLKQISEFGKDVVDTLKNELNENIQIQDMIDNAKLSLNKVKSNVANMKVPTLYKGTTESNNSSNKTTSVVNNYTQNINAPKQPSRSEIYRDTQNLLEFVKRRA